MPSEFGNEQLLIPLDALQTQTPNIPSSVRDEAGETLSLQVLWSASVTVCQ